MKLLSMAMLTSLVASSNAQRLSAEDQKLFAWFDKFGYTKAFSKPMIIFAGWPGIGEIGGMVPTVAAFITNETPTQMDTLGWNLGRYRFYPAPWHQSDARRRRYYYLEGLDLTLPQVLKRFGKFDLGWINPADPDAYQQIFDSFVEARACEVQGLHDRVKEALAYAHAVAKKCHLDMRASVERGIADAEFKNLHRKFNFAELSWKDLKTEYERYLAKFPRSEHGAEAKKELSEIQSRCIPWSYLSTPLDQVPETDLTSFYLDNLRELRGFPGDLDDSYASLSKNPNPYVAIKRQGYYAVWSLIWALEDNDLTRVTYDDHVCKVNELALDLLMPLMEDGAWDKFKIGTDPNKAKDGVQKWWEDLKRRKGPDFQLDILRKHPRDYELTSQIMWDADAETAVRALKISYPFANGVAVKRFLIRRLSGYDRPSIKGFISEQMNKGVGCVDRMVAAEFWTRFDQKEPLEVAKREWLSFVSKDEIGYDDAMALSNFYTLADGGEFLKLAKDEYFSVPVGLRGALIAKVCNESPSNRKETNDALRELLHVALLDTEYAPYNRNSYYEWPFRGDPIFGDFYDHNYGQQRICDWALHALTGEEPASFIAAERQKAAMITIASEPAGHPSDTVSTFRLHGSWNGPILPMHHAVSAREVMVLLQSLWEWSGKSHKLAIFNLTRAEGGDGFDVLVETTCEASYDPLAYSIGADGKVVSQGVATVASSSTIATLESVIAKALGAAPPKSVAISVQLSKLPPR